MMLARVLVSTYIVTNASGLKKINLVFRAIFDLSNKIALLILLRMYALYVKKKRTKIENVSKE